MILVLVRVRNGVVKKTFQPVKLSLSISTPSEKSELINHPLSKIPDEMNPDKIFEKVEIKIGICIYKYIIINCS